MVDVANILLFRFLLMRRRDERAEIIIIILFLGEEGSPELRGCLVSGKGFVCELLLLS